MKTLSLRNFTTLQNTSQKSVSHFVAGARVAKAYFKYCQNNLVLITDVSWPSEVCEKRESVFLH